MKIFNFITKQCFTLLCTAFITTQANASVCFLPDAENCGTNDIVTQCDGIRYFTKTGSVTCEKIKHPKSQTCVSAGDCDELKCIYSGQSECESEADRLSYKYRHYECELDEEVGCWQLKWTDCSENTYYSGCSGYNLTSPEDGKACDSCSQTVTNNLCTNKGISYTEYDTRTVYACVPIRTDVRGCSGYNLSSPISDYDCDSCTPDVYKTDYSGNYNYSGKGNTVYSCSKTAGCSGYDLTASDKATKEASGDYRCHECTPTVTDDNGNTTNGTTVYKCGKITTSTNSCSGYDVSQSEKASKESQGYSCGDTCTPTTTYYEDGVEYDAKSGATVYKCGSICKEHKASKSKGCTGNTYFIGAGANFPGTSDECGDCVDCADENNLPTTSECYGLHLCEGAREPKDETPCYCGSHKYFQRCLVEETCTTADTTANGGKCWGQTSSSAWNGYYIVGEKCKKVDGTPIYNYYVCNGAYEKDCEGNPVPAHGMTTCPNDEGADGAKSVECGNKKYFSKCKDTGCKDSITENGGYCNIYDLDGKYYVTTKSCSDGTTKDYYTSCTESKDCAGNPGPAYGKQTCPNDSGTGEVSCGGKKYFDTCTETCKAGGAPSKCSSYDGYGKYEAMEKCTQNDGTKVYYYADCTTSEDCAGNQGIAYGLKTCPSGSVPSGKTVECGGYTYGESCKAECSYDHDEDMCKKAGKTFVKKCHDNNNKWWGECKDKE